MSAALVTLQRATFAYERTAVLVDIDLAVGRGDYLGVVGPSGAGKTTLLKALLGTIRPSAGTVHRSPGLRVGYVPQVETVSWSFPVTAEQVVLMALHRRRVPWASTAERREVRETLERLGVGDLATRHIRALSGGQQQRVFLARAMITRPQLLVLDEPTSGVDVKTRHEVLHLLGHLHEEGLGVLLTTHDLNGMAAHLPDLLCLNRRVLARGHPHDVLTASVLERTYGAPMDVLDHMGVPLVVDRVARRDRGAS